MACHGADAKGGSVYGTMVGGIGSFTTNTRVLTPGSMYPYAPILFDYIRRTMPMDRPQTLTNDRGLRAVGVPPESERPRPGQCGHGRRIVDEGEMPNRNGFIRDDRPDTSAKRCMTNC